MVKPSRLKAIGEYIDEGGKFPTNIVINLKVDGHLTFEVQGSFGDTSTGILSLPGLYGSAWIIDGQHRLYGYAYASRPEEDDKSVVPVLAYENLPEREEIELFVDINTQQVKINPSLVKEIVSSLNIEHEDPKKKLEALHARTGLRLDDYPTSPLRDRILTVSQQKDNFRCLTLKSLADGIEENNLLGTIHRSKSGGAVVVLPGPLADVSMDPKGTMAKAVSTLSQYFSLFATGLEEHWQLGDAKGGYLCTNNGIRALLQLLRRVLAFVESRKSVRATLLDPEHVVELVQQYVRHVVDYFKSARPEDISAFRNRGSSLQSVDKNCFQMMSIIYERDQSFDLPEIVNYLNSRDIEGTETARGMIDDINRILYEDVVSKLKQTYGTEKDAWWQHGVPVPIKNSCDEQFNRNPGEHDRWQYLYLINYLDIIMYKNHWDLFKDNYDFYAKGKKAYRVRWITKVNKSRTVTHHAEKGPLSKSEVEFVKQVHDLVKTHILEGEKIVPKQQYLTEPGDEAVDAAQSAAA